MQKNFKTVRFKKTKKEFKKQRMLDNIEESYLEDGRI